MWKLGVLLLIMAVGFVVHQEIKIFRKKEEERIKKLNALTACKEELSDEQRRSSTLDIIAETTVTKVHNNAFEKEINKFKE